MASLSGPDPWSAGVSRRTRKPKSPVIASYRRLAAAMDGNRPLILTHTASGPQYAVDGVTVKMSVAEAAIGEGWLRPAHDGLLPGTDQSWLMEVHRGDYD
jgi:hypothetical protein